jgi:arylsulfatase A-like enzyme
MQSKQGKPETMRSSARQSTRRSFLKLASAVGVQSLSRIAAQSTLASGRRPPNIVFIMADDLGYGHLGCYGQKKIRTPNLDRMAAEGIRFTQHYSGCTVCAPARSTLMTGLHTGHTPVRGNSGGMPLLADDVTVVEVLKSAGYATGLFGKWGLGDAGTSGVPTKQGFDEFYGYLHQLHAHFYYPHFLWRNETKVFLPGNREDFRKQYSHDLIAEEAKKFIQNNRERPFFLCLTFTIPHAEMLVPEDSLAEYVEKFSETPFTSKPRMHYAPQPTPRAALAAMITRMDRDIGELLTLLKSLDLDGNTIVIFTSDNGPATIEVGADAEFFEASGPLRGFKSDLYEGGIRVPLIVRWPGKIAAGSSSDHVCAFWDFMPTFAELAGVQPPSGIDGISTVPALLGTAQAGREQQQHEFLYWETGVQFERLSQAVRMGNWKALRHGPNRPLELYNLSKDLGEKNNVAAQNPDIIAKIETYLRSARTEPRPQLDAPSRDGKRYR